MTRAVADGRDFDSAPTTEGGGSWRRLRGLADEPLLHFAVLGALVFAGHRALSRPAEVPTLEVSTAKQRELAELFEQRQGRAATGEERRHLVQRYVEDEVLFREGERLALLQTDPMLRAQLLARMRSLLQSGVSEKPPTEAELLRYYEGHRGDYAKPETVSYHEYWFKAGPNAKDDARRLALALQRGEEPQGADLPSPINYTARTLEELSRAQTPDLARRIWSLPSGVWRVLPSERGLHVVRLDDRGPAFDPPLSQVRERVLVEYRKDQTSKGFQAEVARLTAQWRVQLAEP
jgi:parvulin-like peptidyl-prolyl isomerase